MFQTPPSRTANGSETPNPPRQSRNLVLALGLLLITLVVVLVKDRDFWFGSDRPTIESDMPATSSPATQAQPKTAAPVQPTSVVKKSIKTSTSSTRAKAVAPVAAPADQPPVTVNRTVLPPLEVEVIAGNKHHTLRPGNNATKLVLENSDSSTLRQSDLAAATKAAEQEQITASAAPSKYPLLAGHMNVMGSVVLQALIGADGAIENLRVSSGPAILAKAAQQAVREWKFKPIKENGQAVESKATITVNFSIRVADNPSNPTIADNQPDRIEILR